MENIYILEVNKPLIFYASNQKIEHAINITGVIFQQEILTIFGWVIGKSEIYLERISSKKITKITSNKNISSHDELIYFEKKITDIKDDYLLRWKLFDKNKSSFLFSLNYKEKAVILETSLDELGVAGKIENIDDEGIHGWFALNEYFGRSIQVRLSAGSTTLSRALSTINRFDVMDEIGATQAFNFRIPIDNIMNSAHLLSNESIYIELNNYEMVLEVEAEFINQLKILIKSTNEFKSIATRGNAEIKFNSIKKINQEKNISSPPSTKAIAFYLPQYHPIAENNQWWGEGFTEWKKVVSAKCAFQGHYQPQIPGALGFYDASEYKTLMAQAQLAEKYNLYGFCFYYYWFNGRRVLSKPLDNYITNKINFPFMICWANENWTRRWDGQENEILLKQENSLENDLSLIDDVIPILQCSNYIINPDGGKWLLVYKPSLIENSELLFNAWRKRASEFGMKLHISCIDNFSTENYYSYGVDSSIQFPPISNNLNRINDYFDLKNGYENVNIFDYDEISEKFTDEYLISSGINIYPGVIPGWDNSPRRGPLANIVHGNTPRKFNQWIRNVCKFQNEKKIDSERFLFINAWNEWAEGAHLEPDEKNEEQYLQALSDGLLEADLCEQTFQPTMQTEVLIKKLQESGALNYSSSFLSISKFSNSEPSSISLAKKHIANGRNNFLFIIDSINGRPLQKEVMRIDKRYGLYITGWWATTTPYDHKHQTFIHLSNNDASYWGHSSKNQDRPDVKEKYPNLHSNGFIMNFTIEEVPAGKYSLTFIVTLRDDRSNELQSYEYGLDNINIF